MGMAEGVVFMKFDIWKGLEARTGKQVFLWLATIILATLFYNNFINLLTNIFQVGEIAVLSYLVMIFIFRIILGFLIK